MIHDPVDDVGSELATAWVTMIEVVNQYNQLDTSLPIESDLDTYSVESVARGRKHRRRFIIHMLFDIVLLSHARHLRSPAARRGRSRPRPPSIFRVHHSTVPSTSVHPILVLTQSNNNSTSPIFPPATHTAHFASTTYFHTIPADTLHDSRDVRLSCLSDASTAAWHGSCQQQAGRGDAPLYPRPNTM